jgi:hypothetical protein
MHTAFVSFPPLVLTPPLPPCCAVAAAALYVPHAQDPTNSPAASVVVVSDTPEATTKEPVGSGTRPGAADKASGGAGTGPEDVVAAPVPASPSGNAVSSSLVPASATMGPSSDPVPAVTPAAGLDIVAGLQLEAGMLEGGASSSGALQKPPPVLQSNMDSSGATYRLDSSTAGAGTGNTLQQRSPGSRASVTAGYCWSLGAILVLMAAW